jgi:hypothetical protein
LFSTVEMAEKLFNRDEGDKTFKIGESVLIF